MCRRVRWRHSLSGITCKQRSGPDPPPLWRIYRYQRWYNLVQISIQISTTPYNSIQLDTTRYHSVQLSTTPYYSVPSVPLRTTQYHSVPLDTTQYYTKLVPEAAEHVGNVQDGRLVPQRRLLIVAAKATSAPATADRRRRKVCPCPVWPGHTGRLNCARRLAPTRRLPRARRLPCARRLAPTRRLPPARRLAPARSVRELTLARQY